MLLMWRFERNFRMRQLGQIKKNNHHQASNAYNSRCNSFTETNKQKKHSILNHFNSHACKHRAFKFENETEIMSKSFVLLKVEKKIFFPSFFENSDNSQLRFSEFQRILSFVPNTVQFKISLLKTGTKLSELCKVLKLKLNEIGKNKIISKVVENFELTFVSVFNVIYFFFLEEKPDLTVVETQMKLATCFSPVFRRMRTFMSPYPKNFFICNFL